MDRRRLVRIGTSMVSSLLLQARNLVVSVVVFWLFTEPLELWGTVNQVVATVTLLSLPAKFGLEFTAVQFVSKYRDDMPAAALEAFWQASVLRLVLTLAVGAPMLLVPGFVGPWIGLGDLPELVFIGGLLLVSTSLYEYAAFLLSGTDNFPAMMTARLVYAIVNIGGIGLVAAGVEGDAATLVLMAQVAGGVAALVWCLWALRGEARALAMRSSEAPDLAGAPRGRAMLRDLMRFSVPVTLVSVAGQLFTYLDRVMIPVLANREELGSYAVASSVVAAALFGTYAFRNVARTRLPGALRRDPAEAREALLASYRASYAVAVWISAGVMAVAPDLLLVLYGADAADAASMLRWFVPFVLLSAHANLSATALVAADKPRIYAILMGTLTALNFGLNLALIPILGGHGAIAASTLSLVPLALLAYRQVADAYGQDLWTVSVAASSLPTLARFATMGVVSGALGWWVTAPSAVAAFGAGVLVTAAFGGLLWVSGDLKEMRAAT